MSYDNYPPDQDFDLGTARSLPTAPKKKKKRRDGSTTSALYDSPDSPYPAEAPRDPYESLDRGYQPSYREPYVAPARPPRNKSGGYDDAFAEDDPDAALLDPEYGTTKSSRSGRSKKSRPSTSYDALLPKPSSDAMESGEVPVKRRRKKRDKPCCCGYCTKPQFWAFFCTVSVLVLVGIGLAVFFCYPRIGTVTVGIFRLLYSSACLLCFVRVLTRSARSADLANYTNLDTANHRHQNRLLLPHFIWIPCFIPLGGPLCQLHPDILGPHLDRRIRRGLWTGENRFRTQGKRGFGEAKGFGP